MSSQTRNAAGTPAPNRNEQRKTRTQAAILKAAERVIRKHGFERASIDEIGAVANVGVGSIYHHFGSKEGLLLALIERALESNQQYLNEGFAVEATPIVKLGHVQAAYLRFYTEEPFYFDLIILEYERRAGTYSPEAVKRISAIAGSVLTRIEDLIREAQTAGEMRPVDPGNAARFLWAGINGLLASSRRRDELHLTPAGIEAVLTTGTEIILEGLATSRGMKHLTDTT
jgi:TetR/AcrR family transcriptional regulator